MKREFKIMIRALGLWILLLNPFLRGACTEYHVSPTGTPAGDGSIGDPWDLQTALNDDLPKVSGVPVRLKDGDIVWVHGGVDYNGKYDGYHTSGGVPTRYSNSTIKPYTCNISNHHWARIVPPTGSPYYGWVVYPNPVIFQPWDCTPVVFDVNGAFWPNRTLGYKGMLNIQSTSNNIEFRGFEFKNSNSTISSSYITLGRVANAIQKGVPSGTGSGATKTEINYGDGIYVEGNQIKLTNLIIHNMFGNGIKANYNAFELRVQGCLIYYNGWEYNSIPYGSGIDGINIYNQKECVYQNNIVFGNFYKGIYLHNIEGDPSYFLSNVKMIQNASFENGSISSNEKRVTNYFAESSRHVIDCDFKENHGYYKNCASTVPNMYIGVWKSTFDFHPGVNLDLENNYLVNGEPCLDLENIWFSKVTGNTMVSNKTILWYNDPIHTPSSDYYPVNTKPNFFSNNWNYNNYYNPDYSTCTIPPPKHPMKFTSYPVSYEYFCQKATSDPNPDLCLDGSKSNCTTPTWSDKTGYDLNSGYSYLNPSTRGVYVYENILKYDVKKCHLIVHNYTGLATKFNIAPYLPAYNPFNHIGIPDGAILKIKDAQNIYSTASSYPSPSSYTGYVYDHILMPAVEIDIANLGTGGSPPRLAEIPISKTTPPEHTMSNFGVFTIEYFPEDISISKSPSANPGNTILTYSNQRANYTAEWSCDSTPFSSTGTSVDVPNYLGSTPLTYTLKITDTKTCTQIIKTITLP